MSPTNAIGESSPPRVIAVRKAVLARNEEQARQNREEFHRRRLLVLNVLSAPGSGKTEFLERTLTDLREQLRAAVVVGDLATDNDARRLERSGAPVVQLTTGTCCHLDAAMIARAVQALDLDALDLLVIENVGNLVCPANYDLGEDLRVVLFSVTEGEDKPLKYPVIFKSAHVVIVSKTDMAAAASFDRAAAFANIQDVAPQVRIFETSARTGAGMHEWYEFLQSSISQTSERP